MNCRVLFSCIINVVLAKFDVYNYYEKRFIIYNSTSLLLLAENENTALSILKGFDTSTLNILNMSNLCSIAGNNTNSVCEEIRGITQFKTHNKSVYSVSPGECLCDIYNTSKTILYPGCSCIDNEEKQCTFENDCSTWTVLPSNYNMKFGVYKLKNHRLFEYYVQTGSKNKHLKWERATVSSQQYLQSGLDCSFHFYYHFFPQSTSSRISVNIIFENNEVFEIWSHQVQQKNVWIPVKVPLGSFSKKFKVHINCESGAPPDMNFDRNNYFVCGVGGLRFDNCRVIQDPSSVCANQTQTICDDNGSIKCFNDVKCDLKYDCFDGSDERNCDQMVQGTRCDFNDDSSFCAGWLQQTRFSNIKRANIASFDPSMERASTVFKIKRVENRKFYEAYKGSKSFLLYDWNYSMKYSSKMKSSVLLSPVFPPTNPQAYNSSSDLFDSCKIRLYVCSYSYLGETWAISLLSKTEAPFEGGRRDIFGSKNVSSMEEKPSICEWQRYVISLPRQNNQFRIGIFVNHKPGDIGSYLGIDDLSLSETCFSENTNYTIPDVLVSTCNFTGANHPNDCSRFRDLDGQTAHFLEEDGSQVWTIPFTLFYRVEICGAAGGRSASNLGKPGNCAVFQSYFGENLLLKMIAGQAGEQPCFRKNKNNELIASSCSSINDIDDNLERPGGGGGGGASLLSIGSNASWSVVLAGGNGANDPQLIFMQMTAGYGASFKSNYTLTNNTCDQFCRKLTPSDFVTQFSSCFGNAPIVKGGFGGGGSTCGLEGGGGAGYHGGQFGNYKEPTSFVDHYVAINTVFFTTNTTSNGYIKIGYCRKKCKSPTICRFRGKFLDEEYCACADGLEYSNNSISACECPLNCPFSSTCHFAEFTRTPYCLCENGRRIWNQLSERCEDWSKSWLISFALLIFAIVLIIVAYLLVRYYKGKTETLSKELIEIARLKSSEFLYDDLYFGQKTRKEAIESLPIIDRSNLKCGKILGKGNFGEVLLGSYRTDSSQSVGNPVAVKTISTPFSASINAQSDFCNEALCLGTFVHENIVKLIGVDFNELPYYIIIEYMEEGDLLSFVKKARPNVHNLNPLHLSMSDLIEFTRCVSSGCTCLESYGYVHRDIAARNILLTRCNNKIVAKISDFGMAKEIQYGSEYYRLHGRALLPIKWTPPEAFIDGIFTSKSDVWSFGVLCWEVFSLGVTPYPSRRNEEVMLMLTEGGRLEYPYGIPTRIYKLMRDCWKTKGEDRPMFLEIQEELEQCLQDKTVTSMSFPIHPAVRAGYIQLQSTPQSCDTPQTATTDVSLYSAFTDSTSRRGASTPSCDMADRMKLHELMLIREEPYTSEMSRNVIENLRHDLARVYAENPNQPFEQPGRFAIPHLIPEEHALLDSSNTVTEDTPPVSQFDINNLAVQNTGPTLHRPNTLNFESNYKTPLLENSEMD